MTLTTTSLPFKQYNLEPDLEFDRLHLWHPYSSMTDPTQVWPVVAAEGVRLQLADGRKLIDGMASWWCAVHGYNHPRLNAAVSEQIQQMSHVMFGGLTHNPAIQLAKRLVALTPRKLDKVFLADSGSVSIEVAIKMAIQYQQARGHKNKQKILALEYGYHGDTLGAMSVCDPNTGMHHLFTKILPEQYFVEAPTTPFSTEITDWNPADIKPLQELLSKQHKHIAALILEPIVQGAGGMRFYHPQYLREARQLCDEFDVLLVVDEVATGFGRTGKLFACEWAEITADILCVGKALTSGYLTLAATLTTAHIADTISQGEAGCFMHGPTFMANPLACRVACESIDLLLENNWAEQVSRLQEGLRKGLEPARQLSGVADVRVLGAIGVIELQQPVDMALIQSACVEQGIWIRPFGRLLYIMPPYIMSDADLDLLTAAMVTVLASTTLDS